jgi:hypothetical protein
MKLNRIRPITWLNALLSLPAAVSLYAGFHNALRPGYSRDFQWSGTHLVFHHIDPYHQILIHNPGNLILWSQIPNYLQELYILLLPLGVISFTSARFIWVVLNCVFTILILSILRKNYGLDRDKTLLLALLLLASTPFRIVLGSGTESLLELFFFCLVFYFDGYAQRGIALGLSYLKYSFSPVLFIYLFFRRQYRILAISLIPPVLGLSAMWLFVHGSIVTLAVEPLAVNQIGISPGLADLMVLIHLALDRVMALLTVNKITYVVALPASAAYAWFLSRQGDIFPERDAAALAVASLMCFTHLTYDYVFLIIPIAACLSGPMNKAKLYVLSVSSVVLYGIKIVPMLPTSRMKEIGLPLTIFLLMSGMLILFTRYRLISGPSVLESSEAVTAMETV